MKRKAARCRVRYESEGKEFDIGLNLSLANDCQILIRTTKWAALAGISITIDSAVSAATLEKGTDNELRNQH